MDDGKLLAVLTACGTSDRPVDLAVLLRELERRNHMMPHALPTEVDSSGRLVSPLTSWLQLPDDDDDKQLGPRVNSNGQYAGACLPACPLLCRM